MKFSTFGLSLSCALIGFSIGLGINTLTIYDAQASALQDKSQYFQLLTSTHPESASQLRQSLQTVTLPYHLCQTRSLHRVLQTVGLANNAVNGLLQKSYMLYQLETEQLQQNFCSGKEFNWF